MDSSGRLRATEQLIITPIKPRKVIVASDNFINQNGDFDYIIVYPIHTIHDSDKHKKWYKDVKEDKHPFFIYLPNVKSPYNIIERYVDVSQLISVHKGILLRKHNEVDPHKMLLIEERTLTILSLGEQESEIEQDSSKPAVNE